MHHIVVSRAEQQDVIVMSAAVADFRPTEIADNKLKKQELGDTPSLSLERTTDVLAELGAQKRASASATPLLVGFAAETESIEASAKRKLAEKACDLIILELGTVLSSLVLLRPRLPISSIARPTVLEEMRTKLGSGSIPPGDDYSEKTLGPDPLWMFFPADPLSCRSSLILFHDPHQVGHNFE